MKLIINKCDMKGNIITGYEEVLEGTKEECEQDYRNYHEYEGPVDIEEVQTDAEKLADLMNENSDIPDEAIDEFEKEPKRTLEKYKEGIVKYGVILSTYAEPEKDVDCGYIYQVDSDGNITEKGDAYILKDSQLVLIDESIEGDSYEDIEEWFDTEKAAKKRIFNYLEWCLTDIPTR